MRRRGEQMFKASVDARIRDDSMDALRRSLSEMRERSAEERGYVKGLGEGIEKGRALGWDEAVEMVLKLLLDFKNGNRG